MTENPDTAILRNTKNRPEAQLMNFKHKLGYMCIGSKSMWTLSVVLLTSSVFGCTMFFPPHPYIPPDLPKTELATIEIDTTSEYLKHIRLIELRIDNKLAVRQEIDINQNISIPDVFVAAGEHNITTVFVAETSPNRHNYRPKRKQITTYDVDFKAGGTYLVFLTQLPDADLYIEVIDKHTDNPVGKRNRKMRWQPIR